MSIMRRIEVKIMARPRKCRRVCGLPNSCGFGPLNSGCGEEQIVIMTVDEFETIRLIDWEKLTQRECGEQMQVSRTTVQAIYDEARSKLADCLIHGKKLLIDGGDYKLCNGNHRGCCRRACMRMRQNAGSALLQQNEEKQERDLEDESCDSGK